jgi:MFS family permease
VVPLLAASALGLTLFVRQERRAPDPLMHLDLWADPLIRYANAATLTSGIMMIGVISFLPTFVQGVLGKSALLAGFTLSMMTLGWPIASFVAGNLIVRVGVVRLARVGGAAALAGTLMIALLADRGPVPAGIGSFVLGVGLGFMATTFVVAIQTSVPWNQRGVATASNMLMRILGQALGAALFGGVLNFQMARYLGRHGLEGRVSMESIESLMGDAAPRAAALTADVMALLRVGLDDSLHAVFWGIVAMAVITLVAALRVPELDTEPVEGSSEAMMH